MATLLPRWSNLTSVSRLIEVCPSTCHLLQVHARLTSLALFPSWSPKLLRRASQLGDLAYAVKLFRTVDSPGVFSVNNVIEAFRSSSPPERAFGLYLGGGFSPNSYTVYVRVGELGLAHKLFDSMPERNVVSWNVMINGYLKGNNPGSALMVFRKMVANGLKGNERTIASVVSACGRS